jgi:hypothetical protein
MVAFAMCRGSGGMGMLCQVVEFGGSTVRALGHRFLLCCSMRTNIKRICGQILPGHGTTQSDFWSWFPRSEWIPGNGC